MAKESWKRKVVRPAKSFPESGKRLSGRTREELEVKLWDRGLLR